MANPFKAATAVLALLLLVLLGAWLARGGPRLFGSSRHTDPQTAATPAPASRPAIPPLDAAARTKTETATFALG